LVEQDKYVETYGYNYGEKVVDTNYEFNNNTKKLFDKVTTSIVYTPNVLSWDSLFDNKQIVYTVPYEIYVQCGGKDNKYEKQFGNYFLWNGLQNFDTTTPLRGVIISDESLYQESNNIRCYTQDSTNSEPVPDIIGVNTFPNLSIKANYFNHTCLFEIPKVLYTPFLDILIRGEVNGNGIYTNIWSRYIQERYNQQNKIVTCSVYLTMQDYSNFNFNKFVRIENQLYIVNKIDNYDFSNNSTKVELITIRDISSYRVNNYNYVGLLNEDGSQPSDNIVLDERKTFKVTSSSKSKIIAIDENLINSERLIINDFLIQPTTPLPIELGDTLTLSASNLEQSDEINGTITLSESFNEGFNDIYVQLPSNL
jgi:hypothetical protein